jgi:membrane protease YdiL (CAAX protease family)
MSVATADPRRGVAEPRRGVAEPLALAVVFAAAMAVRMSLSGYAGAASIPAALVFAGLLAAVATGRRPVPAVGLRSAAMGLAAAITLVIPALLVRGVAHPLPGGSQLRWSLAVTVVATAEEAFLRGVLFDALSRWRGSNVAVVGAAVAFAAMHVPLYGWHILPVDFAVGLLLGALRLASGGWAAPAVAHVGADLAGWWFV